MLEMEDKLASRSVTKTQKGFMFPSTLPKTRGRKGKKKNLQRGSFFSALITGLVSDRSFSKSYKLEGGTWNRD